MFVDCSATLACGTVDPCAQVAMGSVVHCTIFKNVSQHQATNLAMDIRAVRLQRKSSDPRALLLQLNRRIEKLSLFWVFTITRVWGASSEPSSRRACQVITWDARIYKARAADLAPAGVTESDFSLYLPLPADFKGSSGGFYGRSLVVAWLNGSSVACRSVWGGLGPSVV